MHSRDRAADGRGISCLFEPWAARAWPLRVFGGERYRVRILDESVAQQLFEPFFTTRSAGTGLGLATLLEIVREHGGALNVQSRPGHGSRFEAWLPAAPPDSTDITQPASRPLGQGETVLVVENDRDRLLQNEEMLAALGDGAGRV